jgi:hypothetical protein
MYARACVRNGGVRWRNMVVVVVDCDNNFKATMVFTNSFVNSLGRKGMHVL